MAGGESVRLTKEAALDGALAFPRAVDRTSADGARPSRRRISRSRVDGRAGGQTGGRQRRGGGGKRVREEGGRGEERGNRRIYLAGTRPSCGGSRDSRATTIPVGTRGAYPKRIIARPARRAEARRGAPPYGLQAVRAGTVAWNAARANAGLPVERDARSKRKLVACLRLPACERARARARTRASEHPVRCQQRVRVLRCAALYCAVRRVASFRLDGYTSARRTHGPRTRHKRTAHGRGLTQTMQQLRLQTTTAGI